MKRSLCLLLDTRQSTTQPLSHSEQKLYNSANNARVTSEETEDDQRPVK